MLAAVPTASRSGALMCVPMRAPTHPLAARPTMRPALGPTLDPTLAPPLAPALGPTQHPPLGSTQLPTLGRHRAAGVTPLPEGV